MKTRSKILAIIGIFFISAGCSDKDMAKYVARSVYNELQNEYYELQNEYYELQNKYYELQNKYYKLEAENNKLKNELARYKEGFKSMYEIN